MTANEKREVEAFASEIVRRYFCDGDVDFLVSTFAQSITWIGGGRLQKAEGAEAVARCFLDARRHMIPCRVWDEEYVTVEQAPGLYLCSGCSELESRIPEMPMRAQQRITFLFRRNNGGLEVSHIHNSVPFEDIQQGELFPVASAQAIFQNLKDALGQKDRQIELMLSQLPGGMMVCGPDAAYPIKWISDGLCALLGYDNQTRLREATGGSYQACIYPEDVVRVCRHKKASYAGGDANNSEYRVLRSDGSVLWVMEVSKRFEDTDGKPAICSFVTDISLRVARENELVRVNQEAAQQAAFLSQLYDTVPCGIVQVGFNPEPYVAFVNKKAIDIYGISEFEDSHDKLYEIMKAGPLADVQKTIERLHREGGNVSYERELVRMDGTTRWVSSMIETIANAAGERVLQVIITDITERKLVQMEREQERLIENRSLLTAVCSSYQLILRVNFTRNVYAEISEGSYIAAVKSCGTVDSLFESTLKGVLPAHRDEFSRTLHPAFIKSRFESGEEELYLELQRLGLDGEYHWVSMHCIRIDPVAVGEQDVLGILLVKVLDDQRTEKVRQEQLLRDALAAAQAANHAKSDFLSRMSHDIRTPMNAIIGMSAIGKLKIADSDRVWDCFSKIDTSCRYLLSLINDILDMSRIESGKMELSSSMFDFVELIEQVNTILYPQATAAGVAYEVYHLEPLERHYVGDVLRVNQILMNLLSNALKFTPRGGKVSLHLREVRRANGFAQLEMVIRDSGLGMSTAFLDRIFQPFEQEHADIARNKVGSGLGLSIVYNLVHLMGGTINVQSQPDHGTVFTVELPLGLVDCDEEAEKQRKAAELLRGLSVLVVDDDELIGEQVAIMMENIGARSLWVDSGYRAIEVVQAALETGKNFDVALVDWKMPEMDGLETTRRLRKLVGPRTTIIIITAYDWSVIEADARAAGADSFIAKPLFQTSLRDAFVDISSQHLHVAEPAAVTKSYTGKRVLLVEDNEINMEIARSLLEMRDMLVDVAENGQVAVQLFQEGGPGYYHAILMDIRMLVLDGLDATRAIRVLPQTDAATVPIIAMSANAFDEDKALARQSGMNAYVVKPIDVDVLFSTLNEWIY